MENKTVYLLWETWTCTGNVLINIYQNESDAKNEKARLENSRDKEDTPEYDSYGLVSGIEFSIEKREIK